MEDEEGRNRVLDRVEHVARSAFGSLVERPEPGVIVVKTTGAPYPVIINVSGWISRPERSILTLRIAVALRMEWTSGLSDFLLREHADFPFGRFVRTQQEELWLGYDIVACDCTEAQLAAAVQVLADTSVNTLLVLTRTGALDLLGGDSDPSQV